MDCANSVCLRTENISLSKHFVVYSNLKIPSLCEMTMDQRISDSSCPRSACTVVISGGYVLVDCRAGNVQVFN